MPSLSHETLLSVFADRPDELLRLLRDKSLLQIPRHTSVRDGKADFTKVVPSDIHADLVLVLYNGEEAVLALVLESQLSCKQEKHFSWPRYVADVHARYRCTTHLVVITVDPVVTRWARAGIPTFHPTSPFLPLALGPEELPVISTLEQARAHFGLALLSVLAHGREPGGEEVVYSALRAAEEMQDAEQRLLCYLVVQTIWSNELAGRLEARTMIDVRELIENSRDPAIQKSYREGLEKGMEKGIERGIEKGIERGIEKGEVKGQARSILTILAARGVPVEPLVRERIAGCTDQALLERWLTRALAASTAAEVVADS